jgi:hypothetical protein
VLVTSLADEARWNDAVLQIPGDGEGDRRRDGV